MTDRRVDMALDHIIAQRDSLATLEMMIWYATDILLDVDHIFRTYGPPAAPTPEMASLLDAVRDYLLRVPAIDADCHNHPLPRPQTPGGAEEGEASAPPGSNVRMPSPTEIGTFGSDYFTAVDPDEDAA